MATGPIERTLSWQDPQVEKMRGRYFGRYMGFVRDREDPEKRGRVRVQCPPLLGEGNGTDNLLSWCLPATVGLMVPPLDAPVWISFEDGIITNGVYEWGWLGGDAISNDTPPGAKGDPDPSRLPTSTTQAAGSGPTDTYQGSITPISATTPADAAIAAPPEYPYNKVFSSESGHIVELDDTPGKERIRIHHTSGTEILIDPDGRLIIYASNAQCHVATGDYTIQLKEGASFKVVYPSGTSMILGASGFHVTGHQASLLGRSVSMVKKEML